MTSIRIIAPDIFQGDAVGNHCIELNRIFNNNGIDSYIYAERYSEGVIDYKRLIIEIKKNDILLVVFSIYDPNLDWLMGYPNLKICYFHGVTPPKFIEKFDIVTANLCKSGLLQLCLFNKFNHIICNSLESSSYLRAFVDETKILILPPITRNILSFKKTLLTLNNKKNNLFIISILGRLSPHKGIEDGILLLKSLQLSEFDVNLNIIGSTGSIEYFKYLNELAFDLGILDKVFFKGFVTNEEKYELISSSNLVFSPSYHEGFGIPILEAMGCGVIPLVRKNSFPEIIASKCLVYETIEEAANLVGLINNRMDPTNLASNNIEFYDFMLTEYSDEYIFNIFRNIIFK